MKATNNWIQGPLLRLTSTFRGNGQARVNAGEEQPLRSELFSVGQMEEHGRKLALSHSLSPTRGPDRLLSRLAENETVLLELRVLLTQAVGADRRITPAGEWLLDNFYLIEEQISTAKRHLPKRYSQELPWLQSGASAGLPRAYDIALETISHGDGRVDPETLSRFVAAYQTVSPLKLGELWALPIMLRLALIENLRRVATRVADDRLNRNVADHWADLLTETGERDPKSLILVIADMARSNPPMVSSFVAELARRLQGRSSALALPLTWIEQRLSESGWTIEHMVQSENQQQAADQVSISNTIGSLRSLGATDWHEFVETMSVVERTLRQDAGGIYAKMDFDTRDRYRHTVEKAAKRSRMSEKEVAELAIRLAREAASGNGGDPRMTHVGYFLIDQGLPLLERAAEVKPTAYEKVQKLCGRHPLLIYVGGIGLMTAFFAAWVLTKTRAEGVFGWPLAVIGILAVVCASQLAVSLMNWAGTLATTPHSLPRMDLSEGIPAELRTLVVVPSMLLSVEEVESLVEALEVRFLANRSSSLHFGLLTDFRDAPTENAPDDETLLSLVRERIEQLNTKHPATHGENFYLFHRPRRWNARERVWMGYERKRGKLSDLNALLRGGQNQFSLVVGSISHLSGVKYVITLDTDTQLPRDAAWQFIGAMAHPLNHPRYDETRQRVSEGYTILQPRVGVSFPETYRTRYERLHGSEPGIDPYTRAVSDVYQDLFGEGSFIGKGIYDVDMFEKALGGRFPENRILSHDLLEGCYARAGLLSDVQLYEHYPGRYAADVSRRHRWIRGDWQIARWLLPQAPGGDGAGRKNPISALSRWKLFDNLRRSLLAPALTLLLLLGWMVVPSAWYIPLSVIAITLIPALVAFVHDAYRKPDDVLVSRHLSVIVRSAGKRVLEGGFALVCLPYEAYYSLDAILRTSARMLITRRRLLEWNPSGGRERRSDLMASCRKMWIGPAIAVAAMASLSFSTPATIGVAIPILVLWATSPVIAWWVSRPQSRREARLTPDDAVFLRKIARKTWAFFETFVGPEDHWLPPDNYQEQPVPVIAHRTSPTNMGLSLLANLAAYDFGYIPAGQLLQRTSNTFETMSGLERRDGHFYNWYDTLSLRPLPPLYLSTVDSGNLCGHLLTLRPGLAALAGDKIVNAHVFEGLRDTLRLWADETEGKAPAPLAQLRQDLDLACDSPPAALAGVFQFLSRVAEPASDAAPTSFWAAALARQCQSLLDDLSFLAPWLLLPASADHPDSEPVPTLQELSEPQTGTAESRLRAQARIAVIERLVRACNDFATVEYGSLYDGARHLLAIGYNVDERRRDSGYYDLLASEARLCCFVAIAQGHLPQESWFALGRLLTNPGGDPVLVSWSGSMFEYLMPLLVMPTFDDTLLDETVKGAVKAQIEYGEKRGVPWGVSESGYNAIDVHLNYQYRAFGVPGLGLKRGLAEDLVIAPYATVLALMVSPEAACLNLRRLEDEGFEGQYGFYEAVDFTGSRLPRGKSHVVVRSFMAHHQGMSLLSLTYLLLDRPMQRRFESDPLFQATTLLLQEKVPTARAIYTHHTDSSDIHAESGAGDMPARVLRTPDTPVPEVQLLSNGRYHVMVTNAGGGYSRWKNIAVTRWREDPTCDNWGTFCYIRDVSSGEFWSTAYQPTLKAPENYEAVFSEARAEFRRRDNDLDIHTEIAVSPEDDIEIRRITVVNRSRKRRAIDFTSYAEVVLSPAVADALHPAFSGLFVQTEIIPEQQAIVCTRRPRSEDEHVPWMFHLMAVHGAGMGGVSYETDRQRFIGRGRTVVDPAAMHGTEALSGTAGSVLDPIAAIRCRITLGPEASATINICSGVSETREQCLGLVGKYQDRRLADRVFDLAWTHSQVALRQLNATEADAQLYNRIAGSIIYANPALRAEPAVLVKNRRGQSGLWGYSISGDLPIVLLQIEEAANIGLVQQLVHAHAYWRLKGLAVDLVIWNEDNAGYRQSLHDEIMGLIAAGVEAIVKDRPGDIFVRPGDQMSNEDRILLQSVARVLITDRRGSLAEQAESLIRIEPRALRFTASRADRAASREPVEPAPGDLIFANGFGGFTPDGREYIITTTRESRTPAPWVNILANPYFGTVISESGAAYTWGENAHEFRLTPWSNDPVSDGCGEAFYIRDEESGRFWSPTPFPCGGTTGYVSRHGFGYTVFEHKERGIRSEMWVYVALDASVKFNVLKLRNDSGRSRRLSATGYVEWVLGDLRPKTAMHIVTEPDPGIGMLCARNSYNTEFAGRIAVFDVDDATRIASGDRTEFVGRNGTLSNPAAMSRERLSGTVGAGLDPCGALQVAFELGDGEEREIVFTLALARDAEDAATLVRRFRGREAAQRALEAVWQYWKHTLGAVNVETPDQSLDVLANGWLLYQTLSCRVWARNAFYQPGGAFGFRDQLQDVMALLHAEPGLLRRQLLLSASRQFPEGDVQHWWHPPSGRGVRTHCSDDYLWLPLVTCRYVVGTGDTGVLDEPVSFIDGRPLKLDEDSYYDLPHSSDQRAPLYDHCVRAILHGLTRGQHGLPLMGGGDWNDGMNLVGEKGKGESVWLAFFLYEVLTGFASIAWARGDGAFAERCEKESAEIRRNVEQSAWDGAWYRRAYFDDGSPLGSAANDECQIDSIAQSWSVLSGAGDAQRSRTAMDALYRRLVRRDRGLVQLLDPPFDKSSLNPGYIKGYVPGVRENGGQYTHGAIWATMAFARLGDGKRAWELFGMINPVNHGATPQAIATYKVEPYVVAADVYSLSPHIGRGGWTWYTGSAGWMYRLITESLLGLRLEVDRLYVAPCFPEAWSQFKIHYRYRETVYHITVEQAERGVETTLSVDGAAQKEKSLHLVDDREDHSVTIRIARP